MGKLKEEEFGTGSKGYGNDFDCLFFFLTYLFDSKKQPHGVQDPSLFVSDFVCVWRARFFCALARTGCPPASRDVGAVFCVCAASARSFPSYIGFS